MRGRAAAVTATIGAATWLAVPVVSLTRGRSLDDRTRARIRATGPGPGQVLSPPSPALRAAVPAPRPAADDVRRVSGVR